MKILFFLLIGLGAIGLAVGVVGMMLPASRTAKAGREISAPRDQVWRLITDVAHQPTWRKDLAKVELIDATPGHERWVEHPHRGPSIAFSTESRIEPVEWVIRFSGPAEGRWSGRLESLTPQRTRLQVEETSTVSNPWARVLARLAFDPQAFMESYLDQLARTAEQGGS